MQVVSSTPFRVATLLWQPRAGQFAITVLCKATYGLWPGQSVFAEIQDTLLKDDVHHGHDPGRSLRAASDLAPVKPRADVVVVGHAFAPGHVPARSILARIAVGEVDKTIALVGPRYFDVYGALHEGTPVAQFPLAYERAGGGVENPVGLRPAMRDASGNTDVPNLQPEGFVLRSQADSVPSVGFGPIAPSWPRRMEKLGARGAGWAGSAWYRQPIEGVDLSFFQIAPEDQQTSEIRPDERLVLENLHPDHPILVTCLPGVFPAVVVEQVNKPPLPLLLRADTLCIDTDRQVCTVVFRGQFDVDSPRAEGRIVVTLGSLASAARPVAEVMQETVSPLEAPAIRAMPLPVSAPGTQSAQAASTSALPFAGPVSQGPASLQGFGPYTPPTPTTPPPTTPPPPPTTPPPPPIVAPPPLPMADPPPIPQTVGQAAVAAKATHDTTPPPPAGPMREPDLLGPAATEEAAAKEAAAKIARDVGAGGVLAASNAAADPLAPERAAQKRPRRVSDTPGEVLRLVWIDVEAMTKVRRNKEFQPILDELDQRPVDRDADEAAPDMTPAEIEDRREALEILLHALPVDADGVRRAMNDGIRDDGRFVPAALAMRGELTMTFDAIEMLRAIVPIAAAYAGTQDALSAAVAGATAFLATPGHPNPVVAEALAERIRTAFAKTQKKGALDTLDGPAERLMIEQRRFRKCAVFGDTYLRATLRVAGGGEEVPVYLPASAAKKLPLLHTFPCRLLGEVHLAADPVEAHPAALRAAALAEVLSGRR